MCTSHPGKTNKASTLASGAIGVIHFWSMERWPGSYEEALALGFLGTQHGVSDVFSFLIPPVGPPPPAWYIENFRGFSLVPEPSVIVLVGLGGVWLRKRRS